MNNNQHIYNRFLENIKTRREADELKEEAVLLKKGLYEDEGRAYESYLKTRVRAWVAGEISEVFSQEGVNKAEFLQGLLDKLAGLKAVRLVIAFEPSQEQLSRFVSFIKGAAGQDTIVDLTYEPHIIGGAIIVYQGKYKDVSFKKIFEYQFEKEREKLLSLLDKEK